MLETKIQENTEAVKELTAAITALMAALQSTPAPVSAPEPVAPAPAPEPVAPAPEPVAPEKPAPALTGDELRKLCVRAGAEGLTDTVVTFLSERGLQKLAQLPVEQYPDLVALLKSKGVE